MVCIGKYELIFRLIFEANALERGVGRDGHKPWRVNNTVRRMNPTGSSHGL